MSRIIEEMRETAKGLHASGVIDKRRMREYEALHRANHVPQFTGDQVFFLLVRKQDLSCVSGNDLVTELAVNSAFLCVLLSKTRWQSNAYLTDVK